MVRTKHNIPKADSRMGKLVVAKKENLPPWKSPMRVKTKKAITIPVENVDHMVRECLPGPEKRGDAGKSVKKAVRNNFCIKNIWDDVPTGFDYNWRTPSPERSVRDNYSDIEPLSPDNNMIASYLEDLDEGLALGLLTQP